jgi:nicotinamidase-related amidase
LLSHLVPAATALVLIDLQLWTLGATIAPHTPETVVENASRLAHTIRRGGGVVAFTRAAFSKDYVDLLRAPVDLPLRLPDGGIPENALAFAAGIEVDQDDLILTKRQWSAFYGTELDLQLRRRRIESLIVAGVMTNFGVESTARDAWQNNYSVVVARDACSSLDERMHQFSTQQILPRVSRVCATSEIVAALEFA